MKMKLFLLITCAYVFINSCSSDNTTTETPITEAETPDPEPDPDPVDPDSVGTDWEGIAVPASAGEGKSWKLQSDSSDDFNYSFAATSAEATFGNKWTNFYHNNWEGPGPTKWVRQNVSVSGGELQIKASRNDGEMKSFDVDCDTDGVTETWTLPTTRAGCITSTKRVLYPVYIEARVRVANAVTASDVWLLSPDDTQEIDIIEAYGGKGEDDRNVWLAERVHLSHHTFIRDPFQDYQPTDIGSWWRKDGVNQWGGKWVRVGVYWRDPKHLEYYIDGEHVRTLSDNAFASRDINGNWQYTYPKPLEGGIIPKGGNGFQATNTATSLEEAQNSSTTSVIDPLNYLANGMNLDKEMDIIINVEDQNWNACNGRTPKDSEIQNTDDHTFKVDWIRVYKPIDAN
ncbi:family 16 glycosylhydrolase [Aquimarina sp. AU119]|uniref:family 16 glycosylhydrolase n=1 Tax=Aquimarina sp. AU119 TaxID=2108528 RepID=UPI00190EF6EB|nr:family 16 glycosylhydrolase [Aquimarina sp. AU119]